MDRIVSCRSKQSRSERKSSGKCEEINSETLARNSSTHQKSVVILNMLPAHYRQFLTYTDNNSLQKDQITFKSIPNVSLEICLNSSSLRRLRPINAALLCMPAFRINIPYLISRELKVTGATTSQKKRTASSTPRASAITRTFFPNLS